jgi:myosin-5
VGCTQTYTGSILVAVNPYKQLPRLYGAAAIECYRGKPRGSNPPHVYAMADKVHRALAAERASQSVIVSGESGAGKTETCKAVMKFLLAVRGGEQQQGWQGEQGGSATSGAHSGSLDQQIMETNPILEAFGNAKTLRNSNSSRFGKFVQIHFDDAGLVGGASIVTYLLEKSRVVSLSNGERAYHCFYQLCSGAGQPECQNYDLRPAQECGSLARSECAPSWSWYCVNHLTKAHWLLFD